MTSLLVPLAVARADEGAPRAESPARGFGIGVGSSFGYLSGRTRTLELGKIEFGVLDVNLFLPVTKQVTVQAWVPLSFVVWETLHDPFFEVALLARIHPVAGSGFYLGPGIDLVGFKASGDNSFNYTPRVPLTIGYETGVDEQSGFGFTMALRPAFGVVIDTNPGSAGTSSNLGFAWSLMVEFDVTGYFLQPPSVPARPSS